MIKYIYKFKKTILLSLKMFIFLSFCLIFMLIAYLNYNFTKFFSINLGVSTSTYGILFFIFNSIYNGFKFGENKISDIVYSITISEILTLIFTYFQLCILFNNILNITPIIEIFIASISFSISISIVFSFIYNKFFPPKKTTIIYSHRTNINSFLTKINHKPDKYHVISVIEISKNLKPILSKIKSSELVILCELSPNDREAILNFCYKYNIAVLFKPVVSDLIINKASFYQISDLPILSCNYKELSFEQKTAKRISDLVLATILLILTLPIMILTAIAIKLFDKGPIFFTQDRVTIHNKIFKIYKFRSMIINAEKDGKPRLASKNDSRITPIGKIIRTLRIDELPQIINIFKGDMSFVGPRPERPEIVKDHILKYPAFEYRTKVKAGITGFAQIYGKYNTSPIDKLIMDLIYIESFSFLQDLKLLFMTIKIIFISESSEGI